MIVFSASGLNKPKVPDPKWDVPPQMLEIMSIRAKLNSLSLQKATRLTNVIISEGAFIFLMQYFFLHSFSVIINFFYISARLIEF